MGLREFFTELSEGICDLRGIQVYELLTIHSEEPSELAAALTESLEPRDRLVIEQYFGLNGERKTLGQIGSEFPRPIQREPVRLIKDRALSKLRDPHVFEKVRQALDKSMCEKCSPLVVALRGEQAGLRSELSILNQQLRSLRNAVSLLNLQLRRAQGSSERMCGGTPLTALDLSFGTRCHLNASNINTVEQILALDATTLAKLPRIEKKTYTEIMNALRIHEFELS